MGHHIQYSDQDFHWKIWGSNLGRSKRTISSPKYPGQLQCPPSIQLNENHSFFFGSKVARADSLTTHICLEPSLKISGAIPPQHVCSMVHICTTLFYLYLLPTYIPLKRSHPFWSYKGTFLYITFPLHSH
jgi:hypothetical protein